MDLGLEFWDSGFRVYSSGLTGTLQGPFVGVLMIIKSGYLGVRSFGVIGFRVYGFGFRTLGFRV